MGDMISVRKTGLWIMWNKTQHMIVLNHWAFCSMEGHWSTNMRRCSKTPSICTPFTGRSSMVFVFQHVLQRCVCNWRHSRPTQTHAMPLLAMAMPLLWLIVIIIKVAGHIQRTRKRNGVSIVRVLRDFLPRRDFNGHVIIDTAEVFPFVSNKWNW